MGFQIGYALLLFLMISLGCLIFSKEMRRFGIATLCLGLFGLFMTSASSSAIYEIFSPLQYLQFPWRFLGPATLFLAAFSGIASAYILGISRAVGETMVVAIAAGMQPNFTFNPAEPAATITAYIVQVALGDLPHGSIGYQTIFAAGLTLMLLTLTFNILGHLLRRKFREAY